jgi:hypothetical protein
MTQKKPQPMRGLARVTFRANAAMIRTELEQGWTAKAIFERHHAKFGTMSYRQFLRHIAQELGPDVGRSLVARSPPHRGDPPPCPARRRRPCGRGGAFPVTARKRPCRTPIPQPRLPPRPARAAGRPPPPPPRAATDLRLALSAGGDEAIAWRDLMKFNQGHIKQALSKCLPISTTTNQQACQIALWTGAEPATVAKP